MLLDAQAEAMTVQLPIGRVVIDAGDQRRLAVAGYDALAFESRLEKRKLARIGRETLWGGRRGNGNFVAVFNRWSAAMPQPNDLSRSLVALDQNSTIIAVVELSQSSWLVAGMLPGIERQPRKKLEPSPERRL